MKDKERKLRKLFQNKDQRDTAKYNLCFWLDPVPELTIKDSIGATDKTGILAAA